ncbi:MAG TPA: cytidylate kinase-like family protein [Gemmatimonadaceae bacterium]
MSAVQEVRVITISREFGAGGSELAALLGQRLGWPVLDADIVHRVAERLRLDDKTVAKFDEHPPNLLARIATVLVVPQPDIYSFPADAELPSHDTIAAATHAVIAELGSSPPLIVVGHGGQCIFCQRTDVLHVRVVAPLRDRLTRVMRRMNVDAAFGGMVMHRADKDRQAYVQRYFHRDWRGDQLYHLQINTGHITVEEAACMVERLVHGRREAAASLASVVTER